MRNRDVETAFGLAFVLTAIVGVLLGIAMTGGLIYLIIAAAQYLGSH